MKNKIEYNNLIAFHPGSYIEDIIDDLNITQEEFATRLGILPKVLSNLVNGEIKLSADVAIKLEKLTGIDYQTWMNLQNEFERRSIEIEQKMQEDEKLVAKMMDIKYFKDCNFIENRKYSLNEKIIVLRNFFNVSSLTFLKQFNAAVSYRNIKEFEEKSIVNSNAMLEIASNLSRNETENKLNKRKLHKNLFLIKNMLLEDPNIFYPRLKQLLLDCGIVLIALPHLKNSNLHGATKKFKNGSVLLLITDRNKSADIFWFSLIHEIAHILHGDFYTNKDDREGYEEKEKIADEYAANFLMDKDKYLKFIQEKNFTREAILKFSKINNIPEWILLGRLQKDKYVKYTQFNDLKIQYNIKVS